MRRKKLIFTFIILILLGCISLVWGADRGPIRSGETKSGFQLAGPSYMDTWTFNGNTDDRVLIDAEPTSGSTCLDIHLYPPGGGPREASGRQWLDHQLQQTGLYTIVVGECYFDDAATYDITLLKLPGAISSPGDPDGGAIASGETLAPAGELSISDLDAFQFYGNAGDRVLIDAEPTSGSTCLDIYLYPPGGDPREASGRQWLDRQLQQTGLYTIVIGECYFDDAATYDITLLKLPGAISSPGDPDGGAIASGETLAPAGELSISDLDAFQFYGNAGDRVLIDAEPTSGSTCLDIYLYPPGGDPREASGRQWLDRQLQQTGLYTIVVGECYFDDAATYDITLLKLPGAISSPGDPDGGAIASGETLAPAGELSISDLDAFQFYGNAGDRVLIDAEPTSGSTCLDIYLYPPGGDPREASGRQWLDRQLQQTGLYTIVVGECYFDDVATYDISLTKIPSQLRPGLYNPYPANGAIISDLSDFLSWDPVPGATGYDVYFGENVIVPLPKIRNKIPSPSAPFPAMVPYKVYYWHVVAHTPGGIIEGPYWWFETTGSPSEPLLYWPVAPCRIVDTREGGGIIGASGQRNFRVYGSGSVLTPQGVIQKAVLRRLVSP